ncbi:MAG: 1-acyl-sn-glycerol-3-phosphate acyltransferase [Bacteroidota bacterium]
MYVPTTSSNQSLAARAVRRSVAGLIRRSLRSSFRSVRWVGAWPPPLPAGRPVVLYANHHSFFDGYLLWWLLTQHLRRPPLVWMRDHDRIPLFAPLGTLAFPDDDPRRRAQTIRETARRMRTVPDTALILFPEGEQRPPDAGIGPIATGGLQRIARLLPDAVWWPVALRLTWWDADRPVALLAGGSPHDAPTGDEAARLDTLVDLLRAARPPAFGVDNEGVTPHVTAAAQRVLLEGTRSPAERWDLTPLRGFLGRFA